MPAILIVALIGLALGGFRGLIMSVAISFVLTYVLRHFAKQKIADLQTQFHESVFAVMGAVCKADGVVNRQEINAAEAVFAQLRLTPEQREVAKAAFTRGKVAGFDLDGEVTKFARSARGHRPLLLTFLQIQIAAVAADGNIQPIEHQLLVRIARLLGLTEADVAQMEAMLRTGARGGPTPQQKLEDAYAALGLTSAASDAEIKRAYRRLMSLHHPDKLAGRGLPESMRELAEQRTREISTAYALIKEARGLN